MSKSMKESLSCSFFKLTRVSSCQYVTTKKGQTRAVGFPYKKTGWKASKSHNSHNLSQDLLSVSHAAFRSASSSHAGMQHKPMVPYNPNCSRSRLATSELIMPYKNASVIQIGDRSTYKPTSAFKSTYKTFMVPYNLHDYSSNQGIIAERTKWRHIRASD